MNSPILGVSFASWIFNLLRDLQVRIKQLTHVSPVKFVSTETGSKTSRVASLKVIWSKKCTLRATHLGIYQKSPHFHMGFNFLELLGVSLKNLKLCFGMFFSFQPQGVSPPLGNNQINSSGQDLKYDLMSPSEVKSWTVRKPQLEEVERKVISPVENKMVRLVELWWFFGC